MRFSSRRCGSCAARHARAGDASRVCVNAVVDPVLPRRPAWVRRRRRSTSPIHGQSRQARLTCPSDDELQHPVSIGALGDAWTRARACFDRQVGGGRDWRRVRLTNAFPSSRRTSLSRGFAAQMPDRLATLPAVCRGSVRQVVFDARHQQHFRVFEHVDLIVIRSALAWWKSPVFNAGCPPRCVRGA